MRAERIHPDEIPTDVAQVRRLLAAQFPQWADLPIERVESGGTENALYRLGDALVARLPLRASAKRESLEKEHRWLPVLAPQLPLTVPVPVAKGEPGEGYPGHWSVHPWLEGEEAELGRIADPVEAAKSLAEFVVALREIDASGGPAPGRHNFWRGVSLQARDDYTRASLAQLDGEVDVDAATAAWEAALAAPAWDGTPVWVHGDISPDNLLAVDGRVTAVIDFGGLGVGDPATDLQVGWNLFEGESRAAFREAVQVDDATWTRGRGLVLSVAIVALPYYLHTNPVMVQGARKAIDVVLADHTQSV